MPSDAEYIRIVRLALAGLGARLKFPYDDIEDIKLAVSEACNNAVLHATGAGGVVVRCTQTPDSLEIEVRDQGAGLSAALGARPPAEELSENGLGLFLMQALMDEVALEPTEGGGTRVNLRKRLPRCL
ncbi:MAG: anti-sigma B factor RsbW [Armatimonadetes bacterium CG_4_10_14_3_um_filter_66_18]|nr:anti-sigma B factor RsbW [Armatimonadota bacterium]PIU94609.1 MAG: anti-sigma B factor RsbW [Armatimonadetes bacterium CG06_land_8_20_14_3_00_66_21]PIX36664.1 MAG: anti-sigma B factor RsbW [Armatimonadetes bacterium CG_4_8_14_3_um_filter_66_20]PIY42956.1 MAG: anti-sigma B factor RsbW [Armatimonadetes bacterium CG_4_10_14_3_um_filter_66_18]PIZ42237.1 MAG: anti-sigma B factor RsbW [Armatimonadetes bacterium CG_4_10_14_0_8_um_filter_66_14]PJB60518.1 MAG: anti-sigma B factor RsbW [Armatimonadet